MNLRNFISDFRRDVRDLGKPPMWSDPEIIDFVNQAEDEACRRAGLLVDSSSSITEISVSAGDYAVELDSSVIYVRRVRVQGGQVLQPRVSRSMDEDAPGWEDTPAGNPVIFVPDWESGKLRIWPPFSSAATLRLTVVRTPLNEMLEDSDEPEIPRRYHKSLLDWVKHLAYQKQDADTMDIAKSAQFEERFTAEFGPPSAAIDEHWAAEQYYGVGEV